MIKIGILCPSNIAYRRFLPALKKCTDFTYIGVAYANSDEWFGGYAPDEIVKSEREKAENFQEAFSGEVIKGYNTLLMRNDIDAVYLPLPPAAHYEWAKKALLYNKHILLEKPSTTCAKDTEELIELAKSRDLAIHENYMFAYHRQINEIIKTINSGEIGDLRLIRATFGFPFRGANDFRYNKSLGGGALLDCGGYPVRLARLLLGETTEVVDANLAVNAQFNVDVYGNATLRNDAGLTAQIAFGMDNAYQCKLEVWGSKGLLTADRVFTPPAHLSPKLTIQSNECTRVVEIKSDDQFCNSIEVFEKCVQVRKYREHRYLEILSQAKLIENIRSLGRKIK